MKFFSLRRIKIAFCFLLFQMVLLGIYLLVISIYGDYEKRKYSAKFERHHEEIAIYLQLDDKMDISINDLQSLQEKAKENHAKDKNIGFLETEKGYMISITDAGMFSLKNYTIVNEVNLIDQTVQTKLYQPKKLTVSPPISFVPDRH